MAKHQQQAQKTQNNREAQTISKWADSPQGKSALFSAIQKIDRSLETQQKLRHIDERSLSEPYTL